MVTLIVNCLSFNRSYHWLFLFLFLLPLNGMAQRKHMFEVKNGCFLYDDRPFQIVSGEMHYSRIPHQYWRHRMRMLKALGLNAVATYVFWNIHETEPGKWDFGGDKNLREYIRIAQEEGLLVILRPGPYVCAEWEFGGYPWWLLNVSGLELRCDNSRFLSYTEFYLNRLYQEIGDLLVTRGGPVIMVQVENEFGSYVAQRKDISLEEHKRYNLKIRALLNKVGFDTVLFTSDGTWLFDGGAVDGALPAANGENDVANLKKTVGNYTNGKGPYMVAEFYTGWLAHWGEPHPLTDASAIARKAEEFLRNNVSFNLYMVHGGTNFGFMSGANYDGKHDIQPDLTSYDYDAPISEAGWATSKYDSLRAVIGKWIGGGLPPVPSPLPSIAVPSIRLTRVADVLGYLCKGDKVTGDTPYPFERLNQGYGYVLYSRHFAQPVSGTLDIPGLRDYAVVYVNGKKQGVLDRRDKCYRMDIDIPFNATLQILVENMGRINYGTEIVNNYKGIVSPVMINGVEVKGGWEMYRLPMSEAPDLDSMPSSDVYSNEPLRLNGLAGRPLVYEGAFSLKETGDTFLDLRGWGKGIVFVNGKHLGRYWNIGPQQFLYVPGVWLHKGVNKILIFEQLNAGRKTEIRAAKLPGTMVAYRDAGLPVEERVNDLLTRMTLEEKAGQLLCPLGWDMYAFNGKKVEVSRRFRQLLKERHVGMLWATYRADPWTKKTLENGLTPRLAAEAGNALQRYAFEHTRLGIPLFLAEEAPHGHMAIGATVFPTGIGLAATWSSALMREVGEIISREIRLQGAHISYGPVLDLARDPRWSRVEETFGEDPVLSGSLGAALIQGLGGGELQKPYATLATLKHFIAYGVPEGGQNGSFSNVGSRELLTNFLPPFREATDAGALSVMTSYNSLDGIPCTSNRYLLTQLLRREWGFRGFTVSDLYSIEGLHTSHYVASSTDEAAVMALRSGLDVDLGGDAYAALPRLVREKKVDEAWVDSAVRRVLRLKFEMGLFEHPYVDPVKAGTEVRSDTSIRLARKCAQQLVTLLKNDKGLLPLSAGLRKVAVVGPNADNVYNLLGDYTAPQEAGTVVTVLEGIRRKIGASRVEYAKGCAVRDTTCNEVEQAVAAARSADVVIAVVGGSSARDFRTDYQETGAAVAARNVVSDMECGEGFDRSSLTLMGRQMELLKALKATGKPLVVIYIEGRPLDKTWAATEADALLTAWYPGQEGGNGIADVLFGDFNPAGRLPVSVPRSVGQLPVYYNKKNPPGHDYVELSSSPLYPFGFGLSFSAFSYSDLNIKQKGATSFEVSFVVRNTGSYAGDEVAQLYLRDEYASVVQPVKQLKRYERFFLRKGESRRVCFSLEKTDFSLINADMERVVEPGIFRIEVGASSDDIRLTTKIEIQ